MYIKSVRLKDFRNYDELDLHFNKKLNLILGNNAQGKTNLLESIYVSSIGKSFRTNINSDLIKFDKDSCYINVETFRDDLDGSVEITIYKDSKKNAKVDGVKISKASELLNNIYLVIFSPEDLKIVKDEPEKRRRFINRELSQIKTSYYDNLSNYKKVLLQRNTYLKEEAIQNEMLDIWDLEISKYGAQIMHQRRIFIDKLNSISSVIHNEITNGKENLKLVYSPNIELVDNINDQVEIIYKSLKKSYNSDLKQRTTTKGPHKDDLEFYIDNINVRNFGSQGQQRTAALSLKLAELNIIKEETGEDAVLLLDDVMSELDYERQEYLIKALSDNQLFITQTEFPEMLKEKFEDGIIYNVSNGKITSENL